MVIFFIAMAGRTVINAMWNDLRRLAAQGVDPGQHQAVVRASQSVEILFLFLLSAPLWFLLRGMRREDFRGVLAGAGASMFALFYIGLPLLALFDIRSQPNGPELLLYMFLVVWCGDVAAYYVGRAIGRRKLAPSISPGKTWEGTIASVIASAAIGTLLLVYADHFRAALYALRLAPAPSVFSMSGNVWYVALLCSIGINIAAQLGDLVESMLKRGARLKDSGSLLPGHGGVLDRIDALLFAAPLVWYYSIFRLLNV
jgi:phosphatidate cytidylyltransferase